jgi:hypothetical protein
LQYEGRYFYKSSGKESHLFTSQDICGNNNNHSLVAVNELISNFVNQDLKEKALLYVFQNLSAAAFI